MSQVRGGRLDPARAIVDLAQADLGIEEFMTELLGTFDRALGADSAVAVRPESDAFPFVTYNSTQEMIDLVDKSARYATTRYAADLFPVFSRTAQVGACLYSDFYSSVQKESESIYHREVLAPAGVRSMLHICASWQGRPLLRLNLNRHGSTPFCDSDREAVLRLLPTLEAAVAARFATEPSGPVHDLTPREREIAELVAQGLTTRQIGVVLGTSPYTVRNQLSRIYEKLAIESRAELAAYAARTGLKP